MTRKILLLILTLAMLGAQAEARDPSLPTRAAIRLPDLPGYLTLKCDFHIHTVFSDGLVWPTLRVEEAWREGLDAIAITDHLEFQPYKNDVSTNHNRSYEIAAAAGPEFDILVIHSAEITRGMPPGHFNPLFITNANALAVPDWFEALQAARAQGAFIIWNHPGWEPQLIDGKTQWFPEHTRIFDAGLMNGIEIVNGFDYYPQPHQWAIDRNLPIFGGTDIHPPANMRFDLDPGRHRPMTLVFARKRTVPSLKEALVDGRTAVFAGGTILGNERFLRPIFEQSVRVLKAIRKRDRIFIHVQNDSSVSFTLEATGKPAGLTIPDHVTLTPEKTVLIEVRGLANGAAEMRKLDLSWRVTNVLTAPDKALAVRMEIPVADTVGPSSRN